MKTIRIQPKERKDMTLPYPYFIDMKNGNVGRQDFWKGEPYKLIGFNPKPTNLYDPKGIGFFKFIKNPELSIGMYPIFANEDGSERRTYKDPIESVSIK